MKSDKYAFALALLCLCLVSRAQAQVHPSGGQGCATIEWTGCVNDHHKAPAASSGSNLVDNPHPECMYCDDIDDPSCHDACTPGSADFLVAVVYSKMLDAARRGDAKAMAKLAPMASEYVVVNEQRGAIQLLSCTGGEVIASLTLRDRVTLTAVAERLRNTRRQPVQASSPRAGLSQ